MSKLKNALKEIKEELNAELNTETKPMGWMGYLVIILGSGFIIWIISMIHMTH